MNLGGVDFMRGSISECLAFYLTVAFNQRNHLSGLSSDVTQVIAHILENESHQG